MGLEVPMPHTSAEIHARLGHPVVDADGHLLESVPILADYVREHANADCADRLVEHAGFLTLPSDRSWQEAAGRLAERRLPAPPWWGSSRDAVDRATAFAPGLLAERLEELGLDFTILYPSFGLMFAGHADDAMRLGGCRALNAYMAEFTAPYRDRMTVPAMVPIHTPGEAIEAIDHALDELGLRSIVITGWVRRQGPQGAYADVLGVDSDYDYDPLWQHCVDRKVAVTTHGGSMGFGFRQSPSRYMYNHIGHFAGVGEAFAKALFMGGVTRRFPDLHFAFLEAGVSWAVQLLVDLVARWDKRGGPNIELLDPARLDTERFHALLEQYGGGAFDRKDARDEAATMNGGHPDELDEFHLCGVERREDLARRFVPKFFFGCEADDPLVGLAYDERVLPGRRPLQTLLGSDLGHWDVPDMSRVLVEAYELVDAGVLDGERFRAFSCDNAIRLHGAANPHFFDGTSVEGYARELLSSMRDETSLSTQVPEKNAGFVSV
jgi:predicted TIM-barrel fold metal-dependent hydrolase